MTITPIIKSQLHIFFIDAKFIKVNPKYGWEKIKTKSKFAELFKQSKPHHLTQNLRDLPYRFSSILEGLDLSIVSKNLDSSS